MKEIAQIMYEGYSKHTNNKSLVTGQDLPTWENLPETIKAAWRAAEVAAMVALTTNLIKGGGD